MYGELCGALPDTVRRTDTVLQQTVQTETRVRTMYDIVHQACMQDVAP